MYLGEFLLTPKYGENFVKDNRRCGMSAYGLRKYHLHLTHFSYNYHICYLFPCDMSGGYLRVV